MVKCYNAISLYHSDTLFLTVPDFNTELVEMITKARGANYYSVHSSREFKKRMDDEFDFMVTPLVYDLELNLSSKGYKIEKVFGSPEANKSTGELMKVNTLFPSSTEGGEVKGGIVLVKLKKISSASKIELVASYEDRNGNTHDSTAEIEFYPEEGEWFENDGIRKGILLTRYANLLKNWIIDERENYDEEDDDYIPRICNSKIVGEYSYSECGIIMPPVQFKLGKWERQSLDLVVAKK